MIRVAKEETHSIENINYIFCSDEYLLNVNQEHLQHDYYTDIITFDLSDVKGQIVADIFISVDRVRENSLDAKTTFDNEMHRVLVHGLLHLIGYNDKTESEQSVMRSKENYYISALE